MTELKIDYRVRIVFNAIPRDPILQFERAHEEPVRSALTIFDPQTLLRLVVEFSTKLLTSLSLPPSIKPRGGNLNSKRQRNSQPTRGLIYIGFFLTDLNAPIERHSFLSQTKVVEAEIGSISLDDMLSSDREGLIETARQLIYSDKFRINVGEEGEDFMTQMKFALGLLSHQAIPSTGNEKMFHLVALLDQLRETQYVEILRKALEELQGLCTEYATKRAGYFAQ